MVFKVDCVREVLKIRESQGFHSLHTDTVEVQGCRNLKDLTWLILAPNMKKLVVIGCPDMEEIISVEKLGEVRAMMENLKLFAKLKFLRLDFLPNLNSICLHVLPFPHVEEISVDRCPNLKKLRLDSNPVKEGKIVIKGKEDWWKEIQWENQATQNAFVPRFERIANDSEDEHVSDDSEDE